MELLKVWQKPRDDMQCDDLHVSSEMLLDFIGISSIIIIIIAYIYVPS